MRSSDSSAAKSRTYLDLNAPANSISTLEGTLPIFAWFFFLLFLSVSSTVRRRSTWLPGSSGFNDLWSVVF